MTYRVTSTLTRALPDRGTVLPSQGMPSTVMPALLLDKSEMKTVPLMIAQLRSADYSKFDMGKVYMFILPVMVVYMFLSKYIIKGVTAGSVKG